MFNKVHSVRRIRMGLQSKGTFAGRQSQALCPAQNQYEFMAAVKPGVIVENKAPARAGEKGC